MARKFSNTIESVRQGIKANLSGVNENGRYAIITAIQYAKNKFDYGVQFWTPEEIMAKTTIIDGNESVFVEFFCAETGAKFFETTNR